jgi:hypothetical protein
MVQTVGIATALISPFVIGSFWLSPALALGGFFVLLPGSIAGPSIYEAFFWSYLNLMQALFAEVVLTVAINVALFWLALHVGQRVVDRRRG